MIQLNTSQTLSAKAGTNNVINVSIFGDLITTTDDFTPHQVLIPSSVGTLYTSTGGQTNIGSMNMVNTTALDVTGIQFYIIGTSTSTNPITNVFTIPASGWAVYAEGKIVIYNSDGLPLSVVSLSTATPQPLGVASAGTASLASRSDHVHVMPTLNQVTIPTANVSLNSKKLTDLADGSSANDAVNFAQLQSAIDGRENKQSCDLGTIAALPTNTYNNGSSGVGATLTGVAFGALVVDGTTVTVGMRILVKNEAATARNGIYVVTTVGAVATLYVLTRATDFDGSGDTIDSGDTTYVTGGGSLLGTTWSVNSGTVTTVGTDPITWTQTAGPGALIGGTGIVITGNTIDAQVDGSTIEIVADTIREKDGGTTNAKLANMGQATFKMRAAAAGTGVPIDGTATQAKTALAIANTDVSGLGTLSTQNGTFSGTHSGTSSGTNTGDQTTSNADGTITVTNGATNPVITRPAITGDVAIAGGSNTSVLATVNTVTPGSFGSATAVPVITVNGKGLTTASAQTSIQIAESQVTNLTTDLAAKQPLDSDLTTIAALVPLVGSSMDYATGGWTYNPNRFNVEDFGADPTNTGDSTVAFYNAYISCALTHSTADRATTTGSVTTSASFSISVGTNTLAASGTLTAMTTRGWVGFTYSGGGGSGTLTGCAITWGVSGGSLLSGSIIGIQSPFFFGGIVEMNAALYKTTQEITNSIPGVWLKGTGAPSSADVGTFFLSGGSFINYTGPAGGTAVRNVPITGTSGPQGGQALNGIKITGVAILCHGATGYGLAGCGFQFISCVGFYLENLYVYNATRTAYSFTTLGAAMLGSGQAEDCNRGTAINLRFREIEFNTAATAAQASAAGLTNPAAVTNLNALSSTTITVSGAPNVTWPTAGTARFQARDALTGSVMWYLVTYTSISGSTLVGCNAVPQFWNETNSTTLVAATPSTSNPLPNATMFAGSLIVPAQGAFGNGKTFHGSATANTCCNTFTQCIGSHFMGEANYMGNSDDNEIKSDYTNRTTAGTPTGIGWDIQGGTAAGGVGASRNNRFDGGSWGAGGIRLRGTGDYSYTSPAIANKWVDAQFANAEPLPIIGTNVFFQWSGNGLLTLGQTGAATAVAQASIASFTGFVNGTTIAIPPAGFQIGTTFRWVIPVSKTLAGTTYSVAIRYGTTNVFATDTVAIATQNFVGTAVVDAGQLEILMTVVGPIGATAAALCQMRLTHNLAITGLSTTGTAGSLQATPTMATFSTLSSNPGPAYLNVAITANAANVFTFNPPVLAEIVKIANPQLM